MDRAVHSIVREERSRQLRYTLYALRRSPLTIVGLAVLVAIVIFAIGAPVIAPFPGDFLYGIHIGQRLQPPSAAHLLGTDEFGRDILSRLIYGSRTSLIIGIVVVSIAATIGVILGAVAGYVGGKVDEAIMRVTDIFLSVPSLVLALVIAASLGPSLTNAMAAISLVWWPWYARLVRGLTLSIREQEFIEAARSIGVRSLRIITRHIIPNCIAPILVQGSLDVGYAILTAASLSFLGVGAQPPIAEWGLMVSTGRGYFPVYWWIATFPGFAIFISVLGFNLLGDGLRDILDPRLRR